MNSSTFDMVNATQDAFEMYKEQMSLAEKVGAPSEVAVVAWIGYDSPDYLTVVQLNDAKVGAEALSDTLLGYQATSGHTGTSDSFVTVEAHSYGSTTAMLALSQSDLGVDALAMYGSAGAPYGVDEASDLNIPDGQVWVGQNGDDPWAGIGSQMSWRDKPGLWSDSNVYETEGGFVDPLTGKYFTPSHGHGEYLMPGTQSLRSLALIALDRSDLVTRQNAPLAPGAAASDKGAL